MAAPGQRIHPAGSRHPDPRHAATPPSAARSKLGGALLVEDVVGALACERLTELKLTAGRERVGDPTMPCVLGSAGV